MERLDVPGGRPLNTLGTPVNNQRARVERKQAISVQFRSVCYVRVALLPTTNRTSHPYSEISHHCTDEISLEFV